MGYILDYLNIHPLLLGLILILIAVFLAALILWGKAIFHWGFYSTHYTEEVTYVKVPPDKIYKILSPKVEGLKIHLEGKKVKEKRRKKRFEL